MDKTALVQKLTAKKIEYSENCPMSSYTTFKIGGPADILISPKDEDELAACLKLCAECGVPYMPIGKGSNLLVSDDGIAGAVIRINAGVGCIKRDADRILCPAGVPLSALCTFAQERGLSGLEFAFGIPGNVGGAVYMNAGAYGGEMRDVVASVRYMTPDGSEHTVSGDALGFGYRKSIFKDSDKIIISAEFSLTPDDKNAIKARMDDFMDRRKTKQPLNYPSAGSAFKRPEGFFAGALIEQCGLKGFCVGGAQISEKHAGFIINKGNATCSDVVSLINYVRKTVKDRFEVELEPEIIKKGR